MTIKFTKGIRRSCRIILFCSVTSALLHHGIYSFRAPCLSTAGPERMPNTDVCNFDYPGPLKYESLNCFQEYLTFASPLNFPHYANNSFTLSGLEWADGPAPIPIFILFKDRVSILIETLRSLYRYIRTDRKSVV